MGRLDGKVILVAGSGGIGSVLARRYAEEGASVVLGDIDVDEAKRAVELIKHTTGRAVALRLDGADDNSIAEAVAFTCRTFGGLDGFHANFACFADTAVSLDAVDLPLEVFDETMRVNVRGFLLCTRRALPPMIERGGGCILYTSSAAAYLGEPTRVAYAMSKLAGHALMRHVAARFGEKGVRANSIAPGVIKHDRWQGPDFGAEFEKWALSRASLKSRLGHPGDIAAMCALLMSEEGSFITGQVINIDGGIITRP